MMPLLATAQKAVTNQTEKGPCVEAEGASAAACSHLAKHK